MSQALPELMGSTDVSHLLQSGMRQNMVRLSSAVSRPTNDHLLLSSFCREES